MPGCTERTTGPKAIATVSISPNTGTYRVGETAQLTVTTFDASGDVVSDLKRPATWTTSNAAIGTISVAGMFTAVGGGNSVTITARVDGKSGTAQFTVLAPVATVAITPTSTTVNVGATTNLAAELKDVGGNVLTGRTIDWQSSNPAIATVSQSGVVTGVSSGGPVTISATSEGKTGTAQLTVPLQSLPLTGVVTDEASVPIAGASVDIMQGSTVVATVLTNAQGQFSRPNTLVGNYDLRVSKSGYLPATVQAQVAAPTGANVTIRLNTDHVATAVTVGNRMISRAGANYVVEIDVAVLDQNAALVPLTTGAFSIPSSNLTISLVSAPTTLANPVAGSYATTLLIDQSTQIGTLDAQNLRLRGARGVIDGMTAGDVIALSAYATSGLLGANWTVFANGFTANGPSLYPSLDALSTLVGGGAVFSQSLSRSIDYVRVNATAANKAVVTFAGGSDNNLGSFIAALADARAANVKVFGVMFGTVNQRDVSNLTINSGGAIAQFTDTRQIGPVSKAMSSIMRGNFSFYRTRWTVTGSSLTAFNGVMNIQTARGVVQAPFYVDFP